MEIPDVVKPIPDLFLDRNNKVGVGWLGQEAVLGDGQFRWREAAIIFGNGEKNICGTIARFGLS